VLLAIEKLPRAFVPDAIDAEVSAINAPPLETTNRPPDCTVTSAADPPFCTMEEPPADIRVPDA
jgi:hypothetical protein